MISAEEFLRHQSPVLDVQEGSEELENVPSGEQHTSAFSESPVDSEPARIDGASLQRIADGEELSSVESPLSDIFVRDEEREKCQEAALRLLDAAARPSGALHDRLLQKEYSEEVIEQVIARLIELGLVNDAEYARMAVQYCISRHMGEMGTLQELKRKGVDAYTAGEAVAQACESGAFVESAYALAEQVAKRTRGLEKKVRLRRLWSAAGRKGHSPDLIRQASSDVFERENEDEEDSDIEY